jgi:uncharacterized RDD family membrane protein YckC
MDCFAEPVIGRRFAPTRWLAMTVNMPLRSRTPIPMSCNVTAQSGGLIMSDSGSGNSGGAWRGGGAPNFQPHAFDPWMQPELFRGVLSRRVFAFLIDIVVLSIPVILACMFIAVFGVVTLGLGWALFWLVSPASVIWALIYYGASLGGPHSATLGMRVMDLELRTWYGAPAYFVLGAMHAVLFWISISVLTPLVLLVGLFNGRRRLLHDMILGTVVINSSVRNPVGQPARTF